MVARVSAVLRSRLPDTVDAGRPAVRARPIPVKTLPDGRAMLNLGCGSRMDWQWNNVDCSPLARLAHHPWVAAVAHRLGWLSEDRYQRLGRIDPGIVLWDLRKGIPFPDRTFDVVYHSHLVEHLDREDSPAFVAECLRVLRPGGTLRIVAPDLRTLVRRYDASLAALDAEGPSDAALVGHQESVEAIFEQMVRREAAMTGRQRPLVRFLERRLRDARSSGEVHRWMYDAYSLRALLSAAGFVETTEAGYRESRVPGWGEFLLDNEEDGREARPGSAYVEGTRP